MTRAASRYFVDLGQHLAECDTNYVRLRKLVPQMHRGARRDIGIAVGDGRQVRVRIEVQDHAPYTSTMRLRQDGAIWGERAPEMTVRVYHDARMAEVVAYQQVRAPRGRYEYPNARMHAPDEKRQLNRLLSEWLAMCLVHGRETEHVSV
jgi:hypothetical protein